MRLATPYIKTLVDDSPTGRLLEGVIESIDVFYSENLRQDIRRGMRENASRGFFNGSRPPYGFRKIKVKDGDRERNKLDPEPGDSVAVQTVQRMFDMASRDIGCKEIAKTLNREGFRTSSGQRWGTAIYKVLSNEAYVFTDPILVFPGGWGDTLPEWLKSAITLESLEMNMRALKGEAMTGTDAEACAYLYSAGLTAPMDHDWSQIYLYIAGKTHSRHKGNQVPDDIQRNH